MLTPFAAAYIAFCVSGTLPGQHEASSFCDAIEIPKGKSIEECVAALPALRDEWSHRLTANAQRSFPGTKDLKAEIISTACAPAGAMGDGV